MYLIYTVSVYIIHGLQNIKIYLNHISAGHYWLESLLFTIKLNNFVVVKSLKFTKL